MKSQHECDDNNYRRDETASANADRRPKELQSSKRAAAESRWESGADMPKNETPARKEGRYRSGATALNYDANDQREGGVNANIGTGPGEH